MTARSKTALTAIYANNTAGDISEQDGRDFIESALGVNGAIRVDKGASTAQGSIGTTPVAVTAFDANEGGTDLTTDQANNDLEVTVDGDYLIGFYLSLEAVTASADFQFEVWAGNPVAAAGISCLRTSNATPDQLLAVGFGVLTLSAGDFIELYVNSDASGRTMTPTDGALFAKMIG